MCDSSKCFIKTATTTLTSTNCAIRTNTTKNSGAKYGETQQFCRQSSSSSHSSLKVSFIIPFQLSPVAIRNKVKKAMPKDLKWACSPRPWQGWSSSHSEKNKQYTIKYYSKEEEKETWINTFIFIYSLKKNWNIG